MGEHRKILRSLGEFLRGRFDLTADNASQSEVVERIESGVVIRGTNLWVLIFATFIASIGLNVNSTAVIIGAMLISPLMGPIMGMGVALGISDFALLKRAVKNFTFMVLISIMTSMVYFLISPLNLTQSELLARTQPTTWDVLIALFGGLAGIVAVTRQDRSGTVIPGVAIATALMPPLCTAGFGLATGQFNYFIGAFYLFVINTVFIGLSALILVNFLKYRKVESSDPARDKRVRNLMAFIIFVTIAPSVYIGYNLVRKSMFEYNVSTYISEAFKFKQTQVVDFSSKYNGTGDEKNIIEVVLLGDNVSEETIETLRAQMSYYGIENADISIKQGGGDDINLASTFIQKNFEQLIVEKNAKIFTLETELLKYKDNTLDISREISVLLDKPISVSMNISDVYDSTGIVKDKILICYIDNNNSSLIDRDKDRLTAWLRIRTRVDNVKLFFNN